jgi:hypothetical protein
VLGLIFGHPFNTHPGLNGHEGGFVKLALILFYVLTAFLSYIKNWFLRIGCCFLRGIYGKVKEARIRLAGMQRMWRT